MNRRDFIRLAGGGAVIAALPACSTDLPSDAVAAWQVPGAETDVRRWALAHAILSPNSHNRQPWVADLREPSAIRLHVDRDRLLPETDPWFRQIVVSQGTFIETLVLALRERGIAPIVTLFPEGAFEPRQLDDRPVARIAWDPHAPPPAKDPLFAQILRRHTAKVDYDTTRTIAPAAVDALRSSQLDTAVHLGATTDAQQLDTLRRLCWESARVELLTERTVMESIRLTRVGPDEISRHRDGISVNGLVPRLFNAVGAFDRSKPPAAESMAYRQMMSRFEGHSRSAMGFVWLSTDTSVHAAANTTRHAEVRAGRAYMRLQLEATRIGLQVHPMSQAVQEFPEMQPHFDRLHQLLVGKPASQETVQMFCRMGYVGETPPLTPRRGVDAIIRA